MKIEFDIFNREFFRTLTFSLKFQKKAQGSIIYMKKYSVSSTFRYNSKCYVVRYYTQFHSNGQNVLAIGDSRLGYHVHQIRGVKWQSGT